MFITTRKTIDMETGVTILLEGYEGVVDAWLKGDSTAKAAEQQQMNFDSQLMSLFQAQYGKQSAITDFLTKQMEPVIRAGGQGFTPQALAAMRTSATDTLSNAFQGAQRAVNATLQRGLPSGVNAQVQGSLMAQEAEQQAAAQNQVTLANENQRQQNYWNSINVLNGQAATENPLGYAAGVTSGTNAVANASEANTDAYKNSFAGQFAMGFGNLLSGNVSKLIFGK